MRGSFTILPRGKACLCDHPKEAGVSHFANTFYAFKGQMPLQKDTFSRKWFKAIMGQEARVITKTK